MLQQLTIDWSQSVHVRENNPESQAHLEDNREKWSHQCKIIFEALKKGKCVGNFDPRVWDDSINDMRKIGHLPRRILDIKKLLEKEGSDIIIDDDWENGYKYYFIKK